MSVPPIAHVQWFPTYRLVPSRYPPVDLFERIAPPEDWEDLAEIEGMTNDRLRDDIGEIALVPIHERVSGPGSTPVMAAFTHPGVSRFSNGTYGVYYAAKDQDTAVAESAWSRALFLRATAEPAIRIEMRAYLGRADCKLHDVRGGSWGQVHVPDDYGASQALAIRLRSAGSLGIVYDSVRRAGGECLGAFKSAALTQYGPQGFTIQGPHFFFEWNGSSIDRYLIAGDTSWRRIPR